MTEIPPVRRINVSDVPVKNIEKAEKSIVMNILNCSESLRNSFFKVTMSISFFCFCFV